MTDECISPLRRRMIEDMTVRNFAAKTQNDYVRAVKNFTVFLPIARHGARRTCGFPAASRREPRRHVEHQRYRFGAAVLLHRDARSPRDRQASDVVPEPRKMPVVLSPEEVARFLEAAPGIKYKAALSVAYGAGLRVSEVASLKVSDIDSERMMLRVEQGKGRKDRYAMLSPVLLALLRDWCRIAQPKAWLFTGQDPFSQYRHANSGVPAMPPHTWQRSASACRRIHFDIALQRIFWSRTPTSE